MIRQAHAVLLLTVASVLCLATSEVPAHRLSFGVLDASCDPGRALAERRAGLSHVVLDVAWDRYEPLDGMYDLAYVDELRRKVGACRAAGLDIVLGPGLQYAPDWVAALPDGTYADQWGSLPASEAVDLVHSAAVRLAAGDYVRRLAADLGTGQVDVVRLGTNDTGELGYAGPDDGLAPVPNSYWAFNNAAQGGPNLAPGMSPAPYTGWHPGDGMWRGRPVTSEMTQAWFDWYASSLVSSIAWQADTWRAAGFQGAFHVLVAGFGVLPDERATALRHHLDGRADPRGALARGLDYQVQFPALARIDRQVRRSGSTGLLVSYTGLGDDTAVRARRLDPPREMCQEGDVNAVQTGDTATWSGQRWAVALARLSDLQVVGENPGRPDRRNTGGSSDSDSLAEQLVHAVAAARSCDLRSFSFAFEDDLFDEDSGVSLADYGRHLTLEGTER